MNMDNKTYQFLRQRLSVFADSFSLEAAEVVLTHAEIEPEMPASLLEQLVSRGQIEAAGQGSQRRYRLPDELRPIRTSNEKG
jgi:hypothetical protein